VLLHTGLEECRVLVCAYDMKYQSPPFYVLRFVFMELDNLLNVMFPYIQKSQRFAMVAAAFCDFFYNVNFVKYWNVFVMVASMRNVVIYNSCIQFPRFGIMQNSE
jgi:hypothetical protein